MPEGPEVRRHADALQRGLAGEKVIDIATRLKATRSWLEDHRGDIVGRRVVEVRSHGKHLIGRIEGEYFFHSHLMMWGTWLVVAADDEMALTPDRRERARIAVAERVAILRSAPIFDVGRGDPYRILPTLATLGPDALPYDGTFDVAEFRRRLLLEPERAIGAALLDQRVVAGLGNYLRAEILFDCAIDPWRSVADLTEEELVAIERAIPEMSMRGYHNRQTVTAEEHARMLADPSMVYNAGRPFGSRYYVFRRTNLPCVRCGEKIRQTRQVTGTSDETGEEKTRITYYCPGCQRS